MSKYKGNIVSATQTVLSGTNYTGKANGKFTLSEQIQAKGSSLWAKSVGNPSAPTVVTASIASANAGGMTANVEFTPSSDMGAGSGTLNYTAVSNPGNYTGSGASSPLVVTGLANNVSYSFTVSATNSLNFTSASSAPSALIGTTVPAAPTSVSGTELDTKSVVSFTAPSSNGGLPITSYTVTSSPGNITATGSASPITVTGLTNGTTYTFTVTAANSNGSSLPSSPSIGVRPSGGPDIGQAYGGGFFAGKISASGDGVSTHYLIISPKASGDSAKSWGPITTVTGLTSAINGPTNSASLAALGATYSAATFCEGLTIGGFSDWYLPSKNELEVLYYFLKPTTTANNTGSGSNPNAASPEPRNTAYTSSLPAQTNVIGFRTGETDAFNSAAYWTSTEFSSSNAWLQDVVDGFQGYGFTSKNSAQRVRAVRRVPIP